VRFNRIVKFILEQIAPPPSAQIQQYDLPDRDKDILATLLVKEAGGEQDYIAGMAGVMNVIFNRAKGNPRDFVRVAIAPKQFSAFNAVKTPQQMASLIAATKSHKAFNAAKQLVQSAIKGKLSDITSRSTHYFAAAGPSKIKAPKWADPTKTTNKIGNHQFYTNIK
jgi:spore germination cell wall hydrolase CwlJ-like protein